MYQPFSTSPMVSVSTISFNSNFPFGVSSLNSEGSESSPTQFDFSIDTKLLLNPNDIVKREMIGEGGYSIVYNGLLKNRVLMAVKIVQPSRTAVLSIQNKEMCQKEVLLLSKMKHDNIVKFVGACIEPQLMIVTERLEGGTLQKFLWDTRPYPPNLNMSLSFALDISRAMEFLHSSDIIHRDLKPRNLFVTSDLEEIKLANFEHAREESTCSMTNEVGSYPYMTPEIFSHDTLKTGEKRHYDHKVDVYGFALVFWELLTNKQSFDGVSNICIAYLSSQNESPSLRDVPDGIVFILEACWVEDTKERLEFKEITIALKFLISSLCSSYSICVATTSSEEANLNEIDEHNTSMIQENNNHVIEPKEEDKKKKNK